MSAATPITTSIMRDDGGDKPVFCLMAAFSSAIEAEAALATIVALAQPEVQEPPTAPESTEVLTSGDVADRVCKSVTELPDRNSPEDWPEAMLVTHPELRTIVLDAISEWVDISATASNPAPSQPAAHDAEIAALKAAQPVEPAAQEPVALQGSLVIAALLAMDTEARKRGEMYPQTADEQREDTRAVRKVIESIKFYTSDRQTRNGWPSVKGWPSMPAPAAPYQVTTEDVFAACKAWGDCPMNLFDSMRAALQAHEARKVAA